MRVVMLCSRALFLFHHRAPSEIYSLSLHDALPIYGRLRQPAALGLAAEAHPEVLETPPELRHLVAPDRERHDHVVDAAPRSEEHTSELQSLRHLVCRLLLEKKKQRITYHDNRSWRT